MVTWGLVPTKFWQICSPFSNQRGGGHITIWDCPDQVLEATGAPETAPHILGFA